MLTQIKKAVERRSVVWRQHALVRMLERDIARNDVFVSIEKGDIIEFYEDLKPYPGCLISGSSNDKQLHIVVAFDSNTDTVYVITAYIPDPKHFESNGRTRKKV